MRAMRPVLAGLAALTLAAAPAAAEPRHAIAMHGEPALPPDFAHFPYANPDAPKGGRLVLGQLGGFDSLNPLIVKGQAAAGMREYVYESLLARSYDEPFTLYGALAKAVDVPQDRGSITFHLDENARFSDGEPLTAEDVLFTWALLKEKGRPNHRFYYGKVAEATAPDAHTVRFVFEAGSDREMPLIMGLMPILPAHATDADTFGETTLVPPIGSGPYLVAGVDTNRAITFARDPDWWGRDLPANRGRFNFGEIRIDYYRDANAMFEAFKAGLVDLRIEQDPAQWAAAYDFPAMRDGRMVREEIAHGRPSGMLGLVFNTRREIFADPRARKALAGLFDFEWVNRTLYAGGYVRTRSYFDNTPLAAKGPPTPKEQALLAPYAENLDPDVMAQGFAPADGSGPGALRERARTAVGLLQEAGFRFEGRTLLTPSGSPARFEILLAEPDWERLALAWADALKRIGIAVQVRTVDSAQYQLRRQEYDFDMIVNDWGMSLSPGNEQSFYWSSQAAGTPGTRNYPGVRSEAVDATIAALLAARTREDFEAAVRALDRALLAGWYVVPLFHLDADLVAHSSRLESPEETSLYGMILDTWWSAEGR